jgi:hypothetical protein
VEPPLEPPEAIPWQPLSSAVIAAIKREVNKQRHDRRTCKGPNFLNVVLAFSTGTRSPQRYGFGTRRVFIESGSAKFRR